MLLIPAITLKEGRVVGADGKPYAGTAEDLASRLADAGIARLQINDEDSVGSERPAALAAVERIANRLDGAALQVVSGCREEDDVQSYLDAGAHWVVLGHRAASAPHVLKDLCLEFPSHILMGMNVRGGRMTVDAHSKLSNHAIADLAAHFQSDGVHGIVYQEVDESSAPRMPDEALVREITAAVSVDVFVAGRIDTLKALDAACALADAGIAGVIVNATERGLDFAKARQRVEDAEPA